MVAFISICFYFIIISKGNDKLYKLTSRGQYELRVNLEDFNGNKAYAKYSTFYIGDKSTNYKLTVNGYSETAGNTDIL